MSPCGRGGKGWLPPPNWYVTIHGWVNNRVCSLFSLLQHIGSDGANFIPSFKMQSYVGCD